MAKVLIAGCGDVGSRLALRLIADGHAVWGLRRDIARLSREIHPLAADLRDPGAISLPVEFDSIFYLPAADTRSDAAYRAVYVDGVRNVLDALHRHQRRPCRIFYVSSTGVYSQDDGRWVNEDSPAQPVTDTGRRLLEGENAARAAGIPCTVVRFAGIYGPGRNWLVNRVRDGAPCVHRPPSYTNRIHSEDCAGVLRHLMNLTTVESLYLGVDDEPAPQCTVMSWIARRIGVPPPRAVPAGETRRATSGNKRCSNRRLIESGFRFRYPTFREGYAEQLPFTEWEESDPRGHLVKHRTHECGKI